MKNSIQLDRTKFNNHHEQKKSKKIVSDELNSGTYAFRFLYFRAQSYQMIKKKKKESIKFESCMRKNVSSKEK